jgi:DNA-binding NtrC family response regulator
LGDENVGRAIVKIVAATNRESALREDFRYRFFPYYIPPLRERKNDILYYFHEIFPDLTKNFSKSEVLLLLTHNWPGNVREIERIGRLLNRERWINEQVLKDTQNGTVASSTDRISYLDPRDTSFDPTILERFVQDLENMDVDISFLEKLLQQHRVSVKDDVNQKAFKELSASSSGYFSWFDENTLTFCDEFGPFDDAYNGYLIFCDLFLQDPAKDDNILATIKKQCTSSGFNHMHYFFEDRPTYQRPLKNLRKKIMKYLKAFDSPEFDYIDDPWELWSVLEQQQSEQYMDLFSADFESEEVLSAISELKEVDLLKRYYRKQLEKTGGNIKAAAKRIGLKENTFRGRLTKLGMTFRKK